MSDPDRPVVPDPPGPPPTAPGEGEALELGYVVALDQFSGPMDLLLYLVRRTELDIVEIPIATITDQFVATVHLWKSLDLDVAGDFIVMAATLLEIKARQLAPPPEIAEGAVPEEPDEVFDPRSDLIQRLLAYRRFKDASQLIDGLQEDAAGRVGRQLREAIPEDPDADEEILLEDLDVHALFRSYELIMARINGLGPRRVVFDEVPMNVRVQKLLDTLRADRSATLQRYLGSEPSKLGQAGVLVATLECIRQRFMEVRQLEQYGAIELRWRDDAERTATLSPPPEEAEPVGRRRRRLPLVTWTAHADAPAEGADEGDGEPEEGPQETDDQRFLRELDESCNLSVVLARGTDIEASFAAHWATIRPPPPPPAEAPPSPPIEVAAAAPASEPVPVPQRPHRKPRETIVATSPPPAGEVAPVTEASAVASTIEMPSAGEPSVAATLAAVDSLVGAAEVSDSPSAVTAGLPPLDQAPRADLAEPATVPALTVQPAAAAAAEPAEPTTHLTAPPAVDADVVTTPVDDQPPAPTTVERIVAAAEAALAPDDADDDEVAGDDPAAANAALLGERRPARQDETWFAPDADEDEDEPAEDDVAAANAALLEDERRAAALAAPPSEASPTEGKTQPVEGGEDEPRAAIGPESAPIDDEDDADHDPGLVAALAEAIPTIPHRDQPLGAETLGRLAALIPDAAGEVVDDEVADPVPPSPVVAQATEPDDRETAVRIAALAGNEASTDDADEPIAPSAAGDDQPEPEDAEPTATALPSAAEPTHVSEPMIETPTDARLRVLAAAAADDEQDVCAPVIPSAALGVPSEPDSAETVVRLGALAALPAADPDEVDATTAEPAPGPDAPSSAPVVASVPVAHPSPTAPADDEAAVRVARFAEESAAIDHEDDAGTATVPADHETVMRIAALAGHDAADPGDEDGPPADEPPDPPDGPPPAAPPDPIPTALSEIPPTDTAAMPAPPLTRIRPWLLIAASLALINALGWFGYVWLVRLPRAVLEASVPAAALPGEAWTWRFNLDVVDPAAVGSSPLLAPSVEPAVPGAWTWRDQRTLEFAPAVELPPASTFLVRLAARDLRSASGFRLAQDLSWVVRTPALRAEGVRQVTFSADGVYTVDLAFDRPVDPAALAGRIVVEPSAGGEALPVTTTTTTRSASVRLAVGPAPQHDGRDARVRLTPAPAGPARLDGPLRLDPSWSATIGLGHRLALREAVATVPTRGEPSLTVRFAEREVPLDLAARLVRVEPAVPFIARAAGGALVLTGAFVPGTTYRVAVEAAWPEGAAAEYDLAAYPAAGAAEVAVGERTPGAWFTQDGERLRISAVNLGSATLAVLAAGDSPVGSHLLDLAGTRNEATVHDLAADELLAGLPVGDYRLVLAAADGEIAATMVSVRDAPITPQRLAAAIERWTDALATGDPTAAPSLRLALAGPGPLAGR